MCQSLVLEAKPPLTMILSDSDPGSYSKSVDLRFKTCAGRKRRVADTMKYIFKENEWMKWGKEYATSVLVGLDGKTYKQINSCGLETGLPGISTHDTWIGVNAFAFQQKTQHQKNHHNMENKRFERVAPYHR